MEKVKQWVTTDGNTRITIDAPLCKGCLICAEVCPKDVLVMVDAPDKWEGSLAEVVNMDACTACMLCEIECPDFAIRVFSVKEKKAAVKA
ncbi:MAG: 4Fe-4S binding protein [bacterium]|nr:4Fe-4S binding protein [bacterium]